ncbi:MAG: iron-containing alcohol dehydrogenase [Thiomicrorhabdus sp.]|jgi:NADP-dependent alcohol dehydrogenase|nr:iron-containing alcohol dehydrogenase [Thiomicrorhabdus sp.]
MIGHEITALFGVDHAKTLAIVQPAVWKVRKEQKKEKLLQYAERVWGITEGDSNAIIDTAIARTEDFFQSLGIHTRLSDYDIDEAGIEKIIQSLEKHGMTALSETGDVTPEISRQILMTAL